MLAFIYRRFCRKRPTWWVLLPAIATFLLLYYINGPSRDNPREKQYPWEAEPSHSGRKRLQQHSSNENATRRGVYFVPGMKPSSSSQSLPSQNPVIPAEEMDFYKSRSKDLFDARAKAGKAKLKPYLRRGDIQPLLDDSNVELSNALRAPDTSIYKGDFQQQQKVYWQGDPLRYSGEQHSEEERPAYVPDRRMIHFDLKGAPPRVDYLVKVLRLAKELGATGVLMEYEDMFPFEGRLQVIRAANHYTKDDLRTILKACDELSLEVMPLVQTFGHLELLLKHPQFSYLRDVAEMPESLCPCHNDSLPLVKDLIAQVMAMHPKATFLHIGCDEVFHLGECTPCAGNPRAAVFTGYVSAVASHVRTAYPGVTPVIWDDMLRNMMPAELQPLAGLVEPMVWVYAEEIYRFVPSYTWSRFAEVFDTVWTASAFKGAHGPTLNAPNVQRHLTNNVNWLELMGAEATKFRSGMRGIVITGWQRYDHFAVLCELLPAGLPSMAVSLLAAKYGYFNASGSGGEQIAHLQKALECVGARSAMQQESLDLNEDPFLFDKMSWCYFPGASVFKLVRALEVTREEVRAYLKKATYEQAWLTDYNIRRNYTSPFRIDEGMEEWSIQLNSVVNLIRTAKQALSEVFDEYTVAEWVEQKVYPLYRDLTELRNRAGLARSRITWPARPLMPLKELAQFGIGVVETTTTKSPLAEAKRKLVTPETGRPKRLVQMPDYYRHPPGSR